MRVLFVSDTHIGFDWPTRPRVVRRRRGDDFLDNFERALDMARRGDVDVVVHGGDLLFRSLVPLWIAEAALAPLRKVAAQGIPVLLVPGNHERARIPFPLLAIEEGLHVFDRPRTVVIERGGVRAAFIGFPYAKDVRSRFPAIVAEARAGGGGGGGDDDEDGADDPASRLDVRVLCLHHCVEGATCGPGNFVFRTGADVIRRRDLPEDVAVTLSGHIHRHQVLHSDDRGPVVYAGSVERTSFAEASETKGFVVLELTRDGLGPVAFHPLPARPMQALAVTFTSHDPADVEAQLSASLGSTPSDAVVQLRVEGALPASLSAATLRRLGGDRNVTLSGSQVRRFSASVRSGRR